jgi:hypothetical protein
LWFYVLKQTLLNSKPIKLFNPEGNFMPKRNWTPEQKKAWGEKMRLAREAKASASAEHRRSAAEKIEVSPSPPEINTGGEETISALMKRIDELEKRQFFSPAQVTPVLGAQPQSSTVGAQVTMQGVVGTIVKYSTNPKDYPDPRDRLFSEPKLSLKGFNRDWWDLEWEVSRVNYDTKDGLHMSEPKFQIRLIRIVEDENGEPSNKRYILWKGTFFEDPEAAIAIAAEKGLEIPEELQKSFLDEMRYLRMRDWLTEAFYPPKPSQQKMNKTETVIGNRLVEVYEINSVNTEEIPFEKLTKKL